MQPTIDAITEFVRLKTREVNIGGLLLGNYHPIRIQTMTTTDTMDTTGRTGDMDIGATGGDGRMTRAPRTPAKPPIWCELLVRLLGGRTGVLFFVRISLN